MLLTEMILIGYRNGFFPMGSPDGEVRWHRPEPRAIIPLDAIRLSRSLKQTLRKNLYTVTVNTNFNHVIRQCAKRPETWITEDIIDAYEQLHLEGAAHSMEAWNKEELVGGLYGVAIGGAFFGESMFSLQRDASKVTFVHLAERLNSRGFALLDTQYINTFTESLGAVEISHVRYSSLLAQALRKSCSFD